MNVAVETDFSQISEPGASQQDTYSFHDRRIRERNRDAESLGAISKQVFLHIKSSSTGLFHRDHPSWQGEVNQHHIREEGPHSYIKQFQVCVSICKEKEVTNLCKTCSMMVFNKVIVTHCLWRRVAEAVVEWLSDNGLCIWWFQTSLLPTAFPALVQCCTQCSTPNSTPYSTEVGRG